MAWGSTGTFGTGGGTTNETSIVITIATNALTAGSFAVVVFACDNNGSSDTDEGAVSGVADSGGVNTWIKAREWCNGQTGAGTGQVVSVWYSNIRSTVNTGGTVTATLTNTASRDATSASGWVFTKGTGAAGGVVTYTQAAPDNTTSMQSLNITTDNAEYLRIRATGMEYGTTQAALTATASWTKFTDAGTGSTTSGSSTRAEFRIVTGTSAASAPATTFTACDMAEVYIVFKESYPTPWAINKRPQTPSVIESWPTGWDLPIVTGKLNPTELAAKTSLVVQPMNFLQHILVR